MTTRPATFADIPHIADLHARRISEGFLSSLGQPFLRSLYTAILNSNDAVLLVAEIDGERAGFVAGIADVRALYRGFLLRRGLGVGIRSAPRLLHAIPRVRETMRYPARTAGLPEAEILAIAVDENHTEHGVGRDLVKHALSNLRNLDITSAKVVTASDNAGAIAMYRNCGFVPATTLELHAGRSSEVLVWKAL